MLDVDREAGGAENLRYGIDPQPPFAPDQLVLGAVLGLRALGDGQPLGLRRQFARRSRAGRSRALRIPLSIVISATGTFPRFRGGGRQSSPRLGGRQPVPPPEALHRIRRARDLEGATDVWVSVHVAARTRAVGGVDNPDRLEVRVELFGDDRRQPCVDSLAHLDLARVGDDRAVLMDPDVGVHRVGHLFGREPAYLRLRGSGERVGLWTCDQRSSGLVDRRADPRIGPAAAEVAAHPVVDLRVVG